MGSDVTFRCEGHDPDGVTTEWFMDDQPLQGKCTIVAELTASLMKKPRGVCFIHIFYKIGFLSIKIREMMRQKYDPLTLWVRGPTLDVTIWRLLTSDSDV